MVMTPGSPDRTALHFSTDHFPERDRVGLWRETIGRMVLKLDIEPLPDQQFHAEVRLRAFNGLIAGEGVFAGVREQRTRSLIADGNDSLCIFVNMAGRFMVSQRGHELMPEQGDAFLTSHSETATYVRSSLGRIVGIVIPRAALAPFTVNIDDAVGRVIPRDTPALGLLTTYFGALKKLDAAASPELLRTVATHFYDLIALSIGATRDAAAQAQGRGVAAARLRAIKSDIAGNLGSHEMSIGWLAGRHLVSPRYIQMMFETEATTFSEFVLATRLDRVHRLLGDRRLADHPIGILAYETGFNDLSYFNRAFRRRYGATPSDIRVAAARCARK